MSTLALLHDAGANVALPALSWLLGVIGEAVRPTVDLLVPAVITLLCHRYIADKRIADAMAQAGGVAYASMAAQARAGTVPDFTQIKAIAVNAGKEAISGAAAGAVARLSADQVADGVEGALGKLLALDPHFSVTNTPAAVATEVTTTVTAEASATAGAAAAGTNQKGLTALLTAVTDPGVAPLRRTGP